ncbi:MAG: hypothetical protein KatS3mg110_3494 [Pirellulaceae bacterium]|nr:MAG: hypothetical protein KatS3mg110_3494 [Pirellulaceae bacterium]
MVNHLRYEAFGRITSETNAAVDFLFAFTGRERDEESGLFYYRARYYDPAVGRFISEDPLGFAAGDGNLARYVRNAPSALSDPLGQEGLRRDGPAVFWGDPEYKWWFWIKQVKNQRPVGTVDDDGVVVFLPVFEKDVKQHMGQTTPPLNPMPWKKLKELADGRTYSQFIKALVEAQAANPNNVWEDGRSKADYWQYRVTPNDLKGLIPEEIEVVKARAKQKIITASASYTAPGAIAPYGLGLGALTAVAAGIFVRAPNIWTGSAVAAAVGVDAGAAAWWFHQRERVVKAAQAAIRDYVERVGP